MVLFSMILFMPYFSRDAQISSSRPTRESPTKLSGPLGPSQAGEIARHHSRHQFSEGSFYRTAPRWRAFNRSPRRRWTSVGRRSPGFDDGLEPLPRLGVDLFLPCDCPATGSWSRPLQGQFGKFARTAFRRSQAHHRRVRHRRCATCLRRHRACPVTLGVEVQRAAPVGSLIAATAP